MVEKYVRTNKKQTTAPVPPGSNTPEDSKQERFVFLEKSKSNQDPCTQRELLQETRRGSKVHLSDNRR